MAAAAHGIKGVGLWVCVCLWACCLGGAVGLRSPRHSALLMPHMARPTCRGLQGVEVDWWVMLKHPQGYQYSYVDSRSADSAVAASCSQSCWQHGLTMLNPNPVSHTLEALSPAATVTSASPAASGVAHVIYNDADPGGTEHFDFAHAKGVVAFSDLSARVVGSNVSTAAGFWLVHSAPRFPQRPGVQGWAQLQHPQSVFGQHFSCFSLADHTSITAIATSLLAAGPFIYSSSLPASLAADYPSWAVLLSGGAVQQPVAVNVSVWTAGGQQALVFAKSSFLHVSLIDAIVVPGLGVSMLWETWRRSHDALVSFCPHASHGTASSLNIDQIAFPGTHYAWASQDDHSKWGVGSAGSSSNSTRNNTATMVVCVGDMNRAAWQAHRGGSYVCLVHAGLWKAFHDILAAAEPCTWHVGNKQARLQPPS